MVPDDELQFLTAAFGPNATANSSGWVTTPSAGLGRMDKAPVRERGSRNKKNLENQARSLRKEERGGGKREGGACRRTGEAKVDPDVVAYDALLQIHAEPYQQPPLPLFPTYEPYPMPECSHKSHLLPTPITRHRWLH